MKTSAFKLCLPIIAMTSQQSASMLAIPAYLNDLSYSLSAIGSLISVGPMLALAARLPAGFVYRPERARALLLAVLTMLAATNFLYGLAAGPLAFAAVHGLNGLSQGAAGTFYLTFYVESLPAGEDRRHAMGYYAGALAVGYSMGGLAGGYVADTLGYAAAFTFASSLGLLCIAILPLLGRAAARRGAEEKAAAGPRFLESLKNILDPKLAAMVVVHLFLNMIHQVGMVFLPLYGLAVGLTLTDVGLIKGAYSMCNAITRPLSGAVMKGLNHQSVSRIGVPLQAALMALVPFFQTLGPLLVVFVLVGFLRAIGIVANTISMVEDVDVKRVSRAVASGVYNASGDVGNIVGPAAGGFIAGLSGIARLFFFAPALIAAVFLAVLWAADRMRKA